MHNDMVLTGSQSCWLLAGVIFLPGTCGFEINPLELGFIRGILVIRLV